MPKTLLSLLDSRQEEGEPASIAQCSWPPCPGSRSPQSPENIMHLLLGALLSSHLQIKLSLVVSDRAQRAPPVQDCCVTCACRMPAVSALAQEYRNTPFYLLALSPSVKYRAPLQRCAQGALVISGLFTYKICLCLKDLMKYKFLGFQCDAFLKTG